MNLEKPEELQMKSSEDKIEKSVDLEEKLLEYGRWLKETKFFLREKAMLNDTAKSMIDESEKIISRKLSDIDEPSKAKLDGHRNYLQDYIDRIKENEPYKKAINKAKRTILNKFIENPDDVENIFKKKLI